MRVSKNKVGLKAEGVMHRDFRASHDPEQPLHAPLHHKDTLHFCRGNIHHPHVLHPDGDLPAFGVDHFQHVDAECERCGMTVSLERRGKLLYEDISHDRQLMRDYYLHGEKSDAPVPLYAFEGEPLIKRAHISQHDYRK